MNVLSVYNLLFKLAKHCGSIRSFFGIVDVITLLCGNPYFQCWSLSILCYKVCELVHLATTHFLAQFLKWLEVKPTKDEFQSFDNLSPWFSNWSFQIEITLTSIVFLLPLLDFILLHLPWTNPSMLWHLQRLYYWFIVAWGKQLCELHLKLSIY